MRRLARATCVSALLLGACIPAPAPTPPPPRSVERAAADAVSEEAGQPLGRQGPLPEHLADFRAVLLRLHNAARAEVGAPPLVWDDRLEAAAAAYGPELARLPRLVHSPEEVRRGQGENLWQGSRDRYALQRMFGGWAGEKKYFRPGIFPNVTTTPRWEDVGHYTQVIWAGTRRLGCAIQRAPEWDYLICRYEPAGNVFGQRVP